MGDRNEGARAPQPFIAARAREMLEYSSDSVDSELDHAAGWLRESGFGTPGSFWQVEGVAGCLGALSNAWGRLSLWARGSGSYDAMHSEFDDVMSALVQLWDRLVHGVAETHDLETLRDLLERMRRLRAAVADSST